MAKTDWFQGNDAWGGPTDWSMVAGASQMRSGPEADRRWRDLLERYRHPVRLANQAQLSSVAKHRRQHVDV